MLYHLKLSSLLRFLCVCVFVCVGSGIMKSGVGRDLTHLHLPMACSSVVVNLKFQVSRLCHECWHFGVLIVQRLFDIHLYGMDQLVSCLGHLVITFISSESTFFQQQLVIELFLLCPSVGLLSAVFRISH